MSKLTGMFVFGLALLMPLAAQDRDEHRERRDHRYYDADRKDYHEWNEAEERAWRRYWELRRRSAIGWERAREEQRREYWRWRHEHPDHLLWPDRR